MDGGSIEVNEVISSMYGAIDYIYFEDLTTPSDAFQPDRPELSVAIVRRNFAICRAPASDPVDVSCHTILGTAGSFQEEQ